MGWFKRGKKREASHKVALAQPVEAVEASAPFARKREADDGPRFLTMASDQCDRRNSDALTAVRLKLREAYRPAQPVTDPQMLAGRTELLATLIRAIEDRHFHTIIFGERGIGKTSLLHVLSQRAREARYHVAYISCGANVGFDEVFRAVAANVPLMFHEDFGPTSPEAERGGVMADLLPEGEVTPRLASELCSKIVGTRVLIVLDEFERVRSFEFRRSVGEFLKNLSDRSVRAHLVIAGVASDLEDLLEPGALVPRNVMAIEVPKMSPLEIEELVHNGEAISSLAFNRDVIEAITLSANGLPYLANLLCQQAGLIGLAGGSTTVTLADVPPALAQVLAEVRSRIPKSMRAGLDDRIREGARDILGRLASAAQTSGGRLTVDDIRTHFPEPGAASRALVEIEKLSAHGVVVAQDDKRLGQLFTFHDANVTAYLWLATVEYQFKRDDEAPRAAGSKVLAG